MFILLLSCIDNLVKEFYSILQECLIYISIVKCSANRKISRSPKLCLNHNFKYFIYLLDDNNYHYTIFPQKFCKPKLKRTYGIYQIAMRNYYLNVCFTIVLVLTILLKNFIAFCKCLIYIFIVKCSANRKISRSQVVMS